MNSRATSHGCAVPSKIEFRKRRNHGWMPYSRREFSLLQCGATPLEQSLGSGRHIFSFALPLEPSFIGHGVEPQFELAPLRRQLFGRQAAESRKQSRVALVVSAKVNILERRRILLQPRDGFGRVLIFAPEKFQRRFRPFARILIAQGRAPATIAALAARTPVAAIAGSIPIAGLTTPFAFA
jgi:hypothetical protein